MAKAKGGRREGAGRPAGTKNPSTLTKEAARDALRQIVLREMDALVGAQLSHAKGLQYLVYRDKKTGKFERVTALEAVNQDENTIEVWEKDPSVQAFTDLMNRALDKPKEQEQEHVISGGLVVKWEDE
jgi:hypothetical protein